MPRTRRDAPCTSVHTRFQQEAGEAYRRASAHLAHYRQLSTLAIHSNDNELWKTLLLRFESGFSTLRSPPIAAIATSASRPLHRHRAPTMRLVSCATPQGPLEDAPRTALLADLTEGERWDGFWSADAYYVRCTKDAGEVAWYRLADDVAPPQSGARVIALRPQGRSTSRVSVVVAQSPNGRRMLVGSARRFPR